MNKISDKHLIITLISGTTYGILIGYIASLQNYLLLTISIVFFIAFSIYFIGRETTPTNSSTSNIQDLCATLGVSIALITVLVAYSAYKRTIESEAKSMYKQYLNLAIENPKFARPSTFDEEKYPHGLTDEEKISYEFFVSQLLYTSEEILNTSQLPEWNSTIESQIQYHLPYIIKNEFSIYENKEKTKNIVFNDHFSEKLNILIRKMHQKNQ
ncbi:hypothetical protein ACLO87_09830 [Paenalcaligenes sp. Me52]|uniref:hypothetical protein n=1 Tax=Paenalcaligenes sp. Me52 TaxID=3392038 RepID=UPI003D2A4C22